MARHFLLLLLLVGRSWSADAPPAAPASPANPPPKGLSRADVFIATFGPSPREQQSLRASDFEMQEQVKLAFYGIDATRVEVEKGRLSADEGQRIIETYQDTLRNFVHDQYNDGYVKAGAGQASDIPSIRKSLGGLLTVARQDALMGREEAAKQAQQAMTQVLVMFSQRFLETCEQQTFPAEVAIGLARQNELLGTGIDVTKCANRRLSATFQRKKTHYLWENCSIDGGGVWKLTMSGDTVAQATASPISLRWPADEGNGLWHAKLLSPAGMWNADKNEWQIEFQVKIDGRSQSPAPAIDAPNDAGPNARPNNWSRDDAPLLPILKAFKVGTFRMVSQEYLPDMTLEGPIMLEERPCESFQYSE